MTDDDEQLLQEIIGKHSVVIKDGDIPDLLAISTEYEVRRLLINVARVNPMIREPLRYD